MKEIKFTLLGVLLVSYFAQNTNAQELKYGVQAGFGLSSVYMIYETVDGSNAEIGGAGYLPALNANFYFGLALNENYTLSFEPGFIRKGMKLSEKAIPFWYLQLPVGFSYSLSEKIHFTLGPEIGYLFSSEIDRKFFKKIDVAVFAGASYNLTNNIEAGIKYSNSINGTWLDTEVRVIDVNDVEIVKLDYYHHYFQLFIRYKF